MLARAAGVPRPPARRRIVRGPTFENRVALLDLDGRTATFTIEPSGPAAQTRLA